HETNICDRKRVGMTEAACRRMTAQLRLEPRETFDDPVPIPRIHVRLVLPEAISQIVQHTQIVQRMDIARDSERDRAHARTLERGIRQQRRLRIELVQVFDDRERLREHETVIRFDRRNQALRVHGEILGRPMLALCERLRNGLVRELLEVQRNAYAVSGRAAKQSVELEHESVVGPGARVRGYLRWKGAVEQRPARSSALLTRSAAPSPRTSMSRRPCPD